MSFESQLNNFMAAIRQQESGGNYQVMGTDHGSRYGVARGAYQIMSEIWPGWAEGAGLSGADWRDPAAQDAVARWRMTKLYNKYGSWKLVAAAWFGGEGSANRMARGEDLSKTMDGFGMDVETYAQEVMERVGNVDPSDRAMGNSAVAQSPTVQTNPLEEQAMAATDPRSELRKTYSEVLDSMSQVIAANPDKYGGMYDQLIPDEALIGEGA